MARSRPAGDSHGMPSSADSLKVFLADDSAAIRARVADLLAGRTRIVGEAETPQACIDGILATRPDVVVLDVQLDGGPGLDVLRAVRQAAPQVAFVVFSNNAGPAYRKRYLAAGATLFLDKSSDAALLPNAVHTASQSLPH